MANRTPFLWTPFNQCKKAIFPSDSNSRASAFLEVGALESTLVSEQKTRSLLCSVTSYHRALWAFSHLPILLPSLFCCAKSSLVVIVLGALDVLERKEKPCFCDCGEGIQQVLGQTHSHPLVFLYLPGISSSEALLSSLCPRLLIPFPALSQHKH